MQPPDQRAKSKRTSLQACAGLHDRIAVRRSGGGYSLPSIDSALQTFSPGPGSTCSCSTLPSFTTMP